jgi:hypothetical protein
MTASDAIIRDTIIRVDLVLTALFAVTAAFAASVFSTAAQWIGAVTAMGLFTVGVFTFLWSFFHAVQRSRTDEISVGQLYLLMGPAIPTTVRRTLNLTLAMQFVIAICTTLARPNGPDGNPGSSLAVGFLVPMLGFGLNGLWAVRHGNFSARRDVVRAVPTSDPEIRQNADHG